MSQTYEDPLRTDDRPRPDEDNTIQSFDEVAVLGQASDVVETVPETQSQQNNNINGAGDETQIQTPLATDGDNEVSIGIRTFYCYHL